MSRDPNNLHSFYEYADEVPSVIRISDLEPCTIPDYDLNDDKEFKKYILDIKKVIRGSFEYRNKMLPYLRENLDMNKCSFYQSVSNADTSKIRIEIHHEPLGLEDIVRIVYSKRCAYHESLEVEHVAKEVMWLHFDMQVGLIPLAETVHELVHNQYLFVPNTKVYGHYKKFVNDYSAFIPLEQREVLERIDQLSMAYEADEYKQLLDKKFIYVDTTGSYDLPKLEDVASALKARIHELLDNVPVQITYPREEEKPLIYPIKFIDQQF